MESNSIRGMEAKQGSYSTIIIGGGQAGLTAGYFLQRAKEDFLILDQNPRTGDSWRARWDSLRLFTPSQLNGLPGLAFPKPDNYFPTKDEMADYLESYAGRFQLPVAHGQRVERLARGEQRYEISAGGSRMTAQQVIVANGPYRVPSLPPFSGQLERGIQQLHSSQYCNAGQVPQKNVLVVGAGNSGAEIALELAQTGKHVWLAGRDVGRLPITNPIGQAFGGKPAWFIMNKILTVDTPMGRRARKKFLHEGHPLGRARRKELERAGIELTSKVAGTESGQPKLADGRVIQAECVIWATGYRPQYDWIDLPILDADGYPRHRRGVVMEAPGLYFLGLPFQTAISSSLVGGVGRDAEYVVGKMRGRSK